MPVPMELHCRVKRKCAEKLPGFYKKLNTVDLKISPGSNNSQHRVVNTWKAGQLFDIEVIL